MYAQASAVDATTSTTTPHEPICDTTMTNASSSTTLDPSAYPHIYEQIIRAADDTALQLRRVSRQTRKEVDARMAFHHVVWDGEFFFKRSPVFLKMSPLWRQTQIMTGHPPPSGGVARGCSTSLSQSSLGDTDIEANRPRNPPTRMAAVNQSPAASSTSHQYAKGLPYARKFSTSGPAWYQST